MRLTTFEGALLGLALVACGGKTDLRDSVDASALDAPVPSDEVCNGLDDDFDGAVDELFRDELGRYLRDAHCGGCGVVCSPTRPGELAVRCEVLEETAVCAAVRCEEGLAPSPSGRCVPIFDRLCMTCLDDADCGPLEASACDDVGGEPRCVVSCEFGCPDGYRCDAERCIPEGGSCSCEPGESFDLACGLRDPEEMLCAGSARCDDGTLSECVAPDEVCDELDNDCDGLLDEGFRDRRGAYGIDIRNCGECGVDCTTSTIPEGDLTCGGDPFAPTCVLLCPDTLDGLDPGDRVDADLDIANGCECTLSSPVDIPGPVGAVGEDLDVNCDGADGIVLRSVYVAPDGDDDAPGSPTRPLRTLSAAVAMAAESLSSDEPRDHVYVASGEYAETVELADGVLVHGGYRRDFLALEPDGFRVELRAPSDAETLGGAALIVNGAGRRTTRVRWMTVRGRDADRPSSAAFGAVFSDAGDSLEVLDTTFIAGVPGSGMNGMNGPAGAPPTTEAQVGQRPRGAIEGDDNLCTRSDANVVRGGEGGTSRCGGVDVSGGTGGGPSCPAFSMPQPSGERGSGTLAGAGGAGGEDSRGPIIGIGCPAAAVCCGLADFTVPSDFSGPQSGENGGNGSAGRAGTGCRDAFGSFADDWMPATASPGTSGTPGSGGGGGGGGGGAEMDFMTGVCEFADGLGGGGGGGGGGGCGGESGTPGTSGGPSTALVVRGAADFQVEGCRFVAADGGRGGDGGAGGDGGRGGIGALADEVPRVDRSTPTLSGPFAGGRGGRGGTGGAGGGAGGGCGGGSIGVWVVGGRPPMAWTGLNDFALGVGGRGGSGGGGAAAASDGEEGGTADVLVR